MKKINTFTLKMIAIISMLIDHIGNIFFPEVMFFRIIGRLSFPIFCYTLVEGFLHTRDVKKYMLRLGIFAILSEIPFNLFVSEKVLHIGQQNVFWTLLLGVIMMYLMSKTNSFVLQFAIVFVLNYVGRFIYSDYGNWGLLIIFVFYIFRERKTEKLLLAGLIFIAITSGTQLWAVLALIPIALHSGEQGPKMKKFFYIFYPAHLLVLYLIKMVV